ncbi:MAG: AAA family ATPase [Gammaproteobacteria bacterium]|nr:AAA family ATPase [Gammaproteobacteria bacterium]
MIIKELHVENFFSLHDVSISLRPLTVLVGPNASGKSNILRALALFKKLMFKKLPDKNQLSEWFWAGNKNTDDCLKFTIKSEHDSLSIEYSIQLQTKEPCLSSESFKVNDIHVISLKNGSGKISDEDGNNKITYSSDKLALESAGAYGNKPVTREFSDFVKDWEFYNFMPELIRARVFIEEKSPSKLDDDGSALRGLLYNWYEQRKDSFQSVNNSLEKSLNFSLDVLTEEQEIGLEEGYDKLIPLTKASDGTLRFLAYYTLINQEDLPLLVAIEEPERNLHPAALKEVASLLEELSKKTQVIITTHSSQLLDSFDNRSLGTDLGVILLHNPKGEGTKVIDIENANVDGSSLQGWIEDFGIGSAVFDSDLIQLP